MEKTFRLAIIAIRRMRSRRDNKGLSMPKSQTLIRGSYTHGIRLNDVNETF